MKKGLLAGTAMVGAIAVVGGTANAAEAPTWKLTGNANFQLYWVDQDANGTECCNLPFSWGDYGIGNPPTSAAIRGNGVFDTDATGVQDHDWYFGVDEAELQLNVSGTADNGLNYGFKIEINANTTDNTVVDEARLQFSGGWGTLQMGDEDGAEDIMNYGGESLMGATGGFDGDQDDYLFRPAEGVTSNFVITNDGGNEIYNFQAIGGNDVGLAAPSYATIAGDTGDATKISYFSPRFSGFQVGASLTPTPNNGDDFKADGDWENHYGIGANYDNSFGGLRIRASVVYSAASNMATVGGWPDANADAFADVSAWSVGGIVGWGPFSLGGNYTDNGDSGQPMVYDWVNPGIITAPVETSYWNVAAGFETGPIYFSAGYFASTLTYGMPGVDDSTYTHIALTADYTVAPGLGVYAEINMISDELIGGVWFEPMPAGQSLTNDTTSLVLGANISF